VNEYDGAPLLPEARASELPMEIPFAMEMLPTVTLPRIFAYPTIFAFPVSLKSVTLLLLENTLSYVVVDMR
jgi:hypothetical protein